MSSPSKARLVLALGALYSGATILGLVLLAASFRLGLLRSVDILFYRGLVLVGIVALGTFAILSMVFRRWNTVFGLRDAVSATAVSLSLNLCFLVLVPVTVDRSISIFVLGEMAAEPGRAFSSAEMSALFSDIYVDQHKQIDRRLREQAVSGNVEKVGDGYRISSRGRLVVEFAKMTAVLFDSRAGLVSPSPMSAPDRASAK